MDRPKTWSELIEMLFAGSWNPALQRFRSPYAFRGLASMDHHLSNSLLRLAAGKAGKANKLLPKRLKAILEEEQSQTFTIDMLSEFQSLKAFDSLAHEPFVLFIEPPSLDTRILNQ